MNSKCQQTLFIRNKKRRILRLFLKQNLFLVIAAEQWTHTTAAAKLFLQAAE
jgi:hypothetical protein